MRASGGLEVERSEMEHQTLCNQRSKAHGGIVIVAMWQMFDVQIWGNEREDEDELERRGEGARGPRVISLLAAMHAA